MRPAAGPAPLLPLRDSASLLSAAAMRSLLLHLHLHLCLPSWSSTPHEGAADSGGLRRLQASLEALVEGVRALRALASLTLITHEGEDEWRSLVAITPALMRAGPALRRCSVHKYVHHLDGEEGPAGGFTRTYTGEAL